jgi:hypothetical protein
MSRWSEGTEGRVSVDTDSTLVVVAVCFTFTMERNGSVELQNV